MRSLLKFFVMAAFALVPVMSQAQSVTLPDNTQTSTITAQVSEQATISMPSTITFQVDDVTTTTNATVGGVTVSNIVTSSAAKTIQISVQANAANFTSANGGPTWAASDVSWGLGSWTNATGSTGTLSNAAYNTVATGTAGVTSLSIATLPFTLAAKNTVTRSGNHTLVITWKVISQ